MTPPSICIEYMLRTLVPPNEVAMPNRPSPVRAGPPPGSSWARPTKPRLSTGSSDSCSWLTTAERSDLVVSISTVPPRPTTSTLSWTAPTASEMRRSAIWPTVSTTLRVSVPNPWRVDSMT